ncbi:MAG: 6,7-dimethyl-8-ribityllumazine synthase [Spirochaetia bacterium]
MSTSKTHVIEGNFEGKGLRIAIVASRFNEFITQKLLEGALDCLRRHNVVESDITVVWVPGSFEVPLAADRLAGSGKFQAVICLGTLIRGETPHFDYIAAEVTKGIAHIALSRGLPVMFGVLTTDNLEQAVNRAGTKAGNKGFQAAQSALEMANLVKQLGTTQ